MQAQTFSELIRHRVYPTVYRSREDTVVWTPFRPGNKGLIKIGRNRPKWHPSDKSWHCPKAHFEELVQVLMREFRGVYVIQHINKHEVCAPACRNAKGLHCECSCNGKNHGSGNDSGWYDVSETFSVRHIGDDLAVRFIKAK